MADSNSGDQQQQQRDSGDSNQNAGGTPPPNAAGNSVINHLLQNKVESTLWFTRLFTVICTALFILPLFGGNPYSFYQRALISAAATCALRMHQRLPNVQLNMDFVRRLFLEDSSHYLMYCIIFLNSYPMTMSLVPVFLFALLHACSFTKTILNLQGPNSLMFIRNIVMKLETQQVNILRFIASTEIFLMPAIILLIFSGKSSFFLPFLYYRFLTLRYSSRRNPYNRLLFSEFRQVVEYLSAKPQCPQLVRNLAYKAIAFISRLAPPLDAQ